MENQWTVIIPVFGFILLGMAFICCCIYVSYYLRKYFKMEMFYGFAIRALQLTCGLGVFMYICLKCCSFGESHENNSKIDEDILLSVITKENPKKIEENIFENPAVVPAAVLIQKADIP